MKHLGDITKIKGCNAPVVDCIIGGSPCQDLSVAGKRAGLAGERSGLYMEQIRIIKEMRYKDEQQGRTGESIRPRYMVWENVPGAFSSNKGQDFAAVIEEAIKVVEQEAPNVPVPEKGWPTSGCIMGDHWSVAWRVLDAQFWGVPQRRRRIALVADFGGQSAPEILFIRKGVSRDLEPGKPKGKETAGDAKSGTGADDRKGTGFDGYNGDLTGDLSATIGVNCGVSTGRNGVIEELPTDPVAFHLLQDPVPNSKISPCMGQGNSGGGQASIGIVCMATQQGGAEIRTDDKAPTVTAAAGMSGNNQPVVCYPDMDAIGVDVYNQALTGDKAKTLNSAASDAEHISVVLEPITIEPGIAAREGGHIYEGVSGTLRANAGDNQMSVAYGIQWSMIGRADKNGPQGDGVNKVYSLDEKMGQTYVWEDQANTLAARDYKQPQMVCFQTYQDVTGPLMANSHPGSYTGQDAFSDMLVAGPLPYQDTVGSLCARDYKGVGSQYVDEGKCIVERQQQVRYIVRRLTPLECERLQGFPDGWTDIGEWVDSKGKKHKEADSPRYKALGNSIALPPWKWVLKRLCACYERDVTMASLFDGIGGFPYIWEQLNGKGSCLWASEIEEFPIAVTKLRFGG